MLSDPPFSRMDLLRCRNALVYMEPVLQKRLIIRPGQDQPAAPGQRQYDDALLIIGFLQKDSQILDANVWRLRRNPGGELTAEDILERFAAG